MLHSIFLLSGVSPPFFHPPLPQHFFHPLFINLSSSSSSLTEQRKKRGGDEAWLSTFMQSGTQKDKMAALIVKLQDSPLHRVGVVESLLTFAGKKSKREALMALGESGIFICIKKFVNQKTKQNKTKTKKNKTKQTTKLN